MSDLGEGVVASVSGIVVSVTVGVVVMFAVGGIAIGVAMVLAHVSEPSSVDSNNCSELFNFILDETSARDYGNTKQGAYMCEADAKAAGDRAAKNEKHP